MKIFHKLVTKLIGQEGKVGEGERVGLKTKNNNENNKKTTNNNTQRTVKVK